MTALPPMFEAGLAALLVACIIRAFFGPPPRVSDGLAAAGWMVAGVSLIATVLIAGHDADPRDVLTAGGVMAICVAGWSPGRRRSVPPRARCAGPRRLGHRLGRVRPRARRLATADPGLSGGALSALRRSGLRGVPNV